MFSGHLQVRLQGTQVVFGTANDREGRLKHRHKEDLASTEGEWNAARSNVAIKRTTGIVGRGYIAQIPNMTARSADARYAETANGQPRSSGAEGLHERRNVDNTIVAVRVRRGGTVADGNHFRSRWFGQGL